MNKKQDGSEAFHPPILRSISRVYGSEHLMLLTKLGMVDKVIQGDRNEIGADLSHGEAGFRHLGRTTIDQP